MGQPGRKHVPRLEQRVHDITDGVAGVDEPFLKAVKARVQKMLLSDDLDMPRISSLATRIMDIANDPNVDIDQIVKVIQTDPFLAGKLLTLINSSYFAMRQEVTSLRHAVVLLGLRPVGDLIFSASVRMKVFNAESYRSLMESLWVHSVGCAVAAEVIGQMRGMTKEPAFLGGLLHDIGKPLVLTAIVETENLAVPPKRIEEEAATMLIDHLHVQVGGLMAKKWQLGESLTESIRLHDAYSDDASPLRKLVYCGNKIAHHLKLGQKHEELVPSLDPCFADLDLTSADLLAGIMKATQEHTDRFTRTI